MKKLLIILAAAVCAAGCLTTEPKVTFCGITFGDDAEGYGLSKVCDFNEEGDTIFAVVEKHGQFLDYDNYGIRADKKSGKIVAISCMKDLNGMSYQDAARLAAKELEDMYGCTGEWSVGRGKYFMDVPLENGVWLTLIISEGDDFIQVVVLQF